MMIQWKLDNKSHHLKIQPDLPHLITKEKITPRNSITQMILLLFTQTKEVQKTAEKLDQNPILVTFFNAGIITYYDNESEFNKTLNINTKTTRASRLAAEATFYKDTNYNGAELKIGAGNYPDLNSYSFDNCISSFKASTTSPGFPTSAVTVRLYADKNYGGRTYAFLIADGPGWNNTYTKDVPNLGDYGLNDNVSSVKIGY